MPTILWIAVVVATAFGTDWLVEGWLGEARRYWVGIAGVALTVMAGTLIKASGIGALTRYLRNALLGAGIGAALNRAGLRLSWLRRGLRQVGVETEPETRPDMPLPLTGVGGWMLNLGWAGTLVGIGMVWTGVFGG